MSDKGIEAFFKKFSTLGFAFRKSTLAAGLMSSAPKPKFTLDLVAFGILTALVFF